MAKKPRKRKPKDDVLTAQDFADDLLENAAFRGIIEQAYIKYIETDGSKEPVNIAITIISDGVNPPTQSIAADQFNLFHPKE